MFRLSFDDLRSEIDEIRKHRVDHGDGSYTYVGPTVPPPSAAEHSESEVIWKLERFSIDKHLKTHQNVVPPPLVIKQVLTEKIARRIILRLSREFHITVEVDDVNSTITFRDLPTN